MNQPAVAQPGRPQRLLGPQSKELLQQPHCCKTGRAIRKQASGTELLTALATGHPSQGHHLLELPPDTFEQLLAVPKVLCRLEGLRLGDELLGLYTEPLLHKERSSDV